MKLLPQRPVLLALHRRLWMASALLALACSLGVVWIGGALPWPGLLELGALVLLAWSLCVWLIARTLAPLDELAALLAAKDARELLARGRETQRLAQAAAEPQPLHRSQIEEHVQRRTRELHTSLQAAEEASAAKSQFLARMSHEIRTPMNGVMGMAQLLATTSLDAAQRNYVDLMQRSTVGLLGLLTELLDFSRLEAGRLDLDAQAVSLRSLLDDVAAVVYPAVLDKRLLFECHLAPDLPSLVHADEMRLRQICLNLVDNAIKFTSVGQVVLGARHEEDTGVLIEVSDTGEGIAPEMQSRVFAPFVQGEDSIARREGGVGLGLAVVDTLVRAMGGRIELHSELGRGASFRVYLPLHVLELADPPLAAAPTRRVAVVSDAPASQQALRDRVLQLHHECVLVMSWRELAFAPERLAALEPHAVLYDEPLAGWPVDLLPAADPLPPWTPLMLQRRHDSASHTAGAVHLQRPLSDAQLARALEPASAESAAATLDGQGVEPTARGRVLLVEDDEVNQVVASSFLEHLGFAVDVAGDADAAMQALQACDYVLLMMDCQLPGMDGCELTRRLRDGEAGLRAQRAPVIALTAHATPEDRQRCLDAGMNDYLAKPINQAQLAATVDRWIAPHAGR